MVVREDFEALLVLKSNDIQNIKIRLRSEDTKSLVEAFIDTCSIMCSSFHAADPIPRLKKIWKHIEPEIMKDRKVEQTD